jgi:hypothetical protein
MLSDNSHQHLVLCLLTNEKSNQNYIQATCVSPIKIGPVVHQSAISDQARLTTYISYTEMEYILNP